MTMKMIGAILIVVGCGSLGFMITVKHKRETAALRNLIAALDFMECELQYRLTPLPELCRLTAESSRGDIQSLLRSLSVELEAQVSPNVEKCVQAVLEKEKDVPALTAKVFNLFGQTLGQFDLQGQLKGIEMVRAECKRILDEHTTNQDNRFRCYQTLGICAGAAMAILFI